MNRGENCPTTPESLGISPDKKPILCALVCPEFPGLKCPLETINELREETRPDSTLEEAVGLVMRVPVVVQAITEEGIK